MGGVISKWRAKPSTVEVLEKIDKEIQALEEFREKNQRLQKLWVGRTEKNSEALEELKSQKKKILEEVMEKETYKTAKLILERFDPESKKAKEVEPPSAGASPTPRPGQEIRQRTTGQRNVLPPTPSSPEQGSPKASGVQATSNVQRDTSAPGGPPERIVAPALQSNVLPRRPGSPTSMPGMGLHPPGPPLARPILPRERGALDRVIEYLVGDGPQNRYALICQQCFSHNGMALKEEFEYIAFRCAYCFFLNPARKTRPQAPRLPDISFEKKQPAELQTTPGTLHSGGVKEQENQEIEEPEVTHIIETDQMEATASATEQQEDKSAEELEKDEMDNETESAFIQSDSAAPAEQSEKSVIEAE